MSTDAKVDFEDPLVNGNGEQKCLKGENIDCSNSDRLNDIRSLSGLRRVFRPMKDGSLRRVVLMWLRMSMGFGMLTLPFYSKQFGGATVCLLILIASFLNFKAFNFIFDASYHLEDHNYSNLIEKLLGNKVLGVFRLTYFIDIVSTIIINSIISWNMFEYIIYFFKIGESHWKDWIKNFNTLEFNESDPTIFKIRGCFFLITFVCILPLILKKNLGALQKITVGYLIALVTLVLIIVIEVPFYRSAYKTEDIGFHLVKPPNFNWLECFLGICGSFYVQPFVFSLRKELFIANKRRINKVGGISVMLAAVAFLLLAFFGYFALGDLYTPVLFILRKPYPGKNYISEMIFRCTITLFFIFSTLGLAMYSSVLRDYVYHTLKIQDGKLKYFMITVAPYFIIFTTGFVYPHVINLTNLFSLTIYNFNGYIIPLLLKIQLNRVQGASAWTKVLPWVGFLLFVGFGITGLVFRFEGLINL